MKKLLTIIIAATLMACNYSSEIGTPPQQEDVSTTPAVAPTITFAESEEWLTSTEELGVWLCPAIDGRVDSIAWVLDGVYVGNGRPIHITAPNGTHTVACTAFNGSASSSRSVQIKIVEPNNLPIRIHLPQDEYTAIVDHPITISATLFEPTPKASIEWSLDGKLLQSGDARSLRFTPDTTGEHTITLSIGGVSREIIVECVEPNVAPADTTRAMVNRVVEYLPAPGQFLNTGMGGRTAEQYAYEKLCAGEIISLGGFGGRLIAGFDRSVPNHEGCDISIRSNAFENSSEPGVVWVMQDVNGNTLADDTWYELRGSESGVESTIQGYAVHYFHNDNRALGEVQWRASDGTCGVVERNSFHTTNNYYPEWIEGDITLDGTMLAHRVIVRDGNYIALPYGWGYVDNFSSEDYNAGWNTFDISNAVDADGTPAVLSHIDFVKIQSAVNHCSPTTGDISTEVAAIKCL